MAKDKKKKKKKDDAKCRETPVPVPPGPHEWTEAVAIQVLASRIGAEAIDRYMTTPEQFPRVQKILWAALASLAESPLVGCSRRPCPPGFNCCDEVCRAEPCEVGPGPKPPKRKSTERKKRP